LARDRDRHCAVITAHTNHSLPSFRGGTVDVALVCSPRFPPPHNQSSSETNLRRDRCSAAGIASLRAVRTMLTGPDGRREPQPDGLAQQISGGGTFNPADSAVRLRRRRYLQNV